MKSNTPLLKTLLVAAVALSFCATPAWADDVTLSTTSLTDWVSVSDSTNSEVSAANYVIAKGESVGWLSLYASVNGSSVEILDAVRTLSFAAGTTFSGSGFFGIVFRQGQADLTVDLTNVSASGLTGQFTVVNAYGKNVTVNISGTSWSGVEYVFGDVESEDAGNPSNYTLNLTGATTFAGISDTNTNRESITVASDGTAITLAGTGTYEYDGALATSEARASLVMNSTGSGKQTFGGTNYLQNVTVTAGTLALGGTTDISGAVTVASGSTLDLSGTITLGSAITNAGTIVIEDGTTFVLDNLAQSYDSTLGYGYCQLIEGSDSTNVTYNADTGNITFSYDGNTIEWSIWTDESGNVYAYGEVGTLTWAGTSTSNNWNYTDENWSVEGSTTNTAFVAGDSATFGEISGNISSTVSITTNITAGSITVNDDYTFTTSVTEGVTVDAGGNLTVAENKTLTIGEGVTLYIDFEESDFSVAGKIAGTGTIEIDLTGGTGNYGSTINLGTDNNFAGTVYIHAGDFTLNGSDIGNGTYELADGVGMQVTANTTITVANDFIIDGATDLHCNTNGGVSSLTLTGSLTGSGTLTLAAGSGNALTISGAVDLGGFTLSTGATVTFENSGETTVKLGALAIASGTVTFNSDATIGSGSGTVVSITSSGTLTVENGATLTVYGDLTDSSTNSYIKVGEGSVLNVTGAITTAGGSAASAYTQICGITDDEGNVSAGTVIAGSIHVGTTSAGSAMEISNVTLITGGITFGPHSGSKFYLYLDNMTLGFSKDVTIAPPESSNGYVFVLGEFGSDGGFASGVSTTTTINTGKYDADSGAFSSTEGYTVTISQAISGNGVLVKDGAGSLVLSATNTFSGGLTIKSGTVVSQNASALGTGNVTVSGGATLQLDVATTVTGTVAFSTGAQLVISGDLLAQLATTNLDATDGAIAIITASDISFGGESLSSYGDELDSLINAYVTAGDYVLTWTWNDGTLYASAVGMLPEPSMFGLLFGLGAIGLVATRRRRKAA